VQVIVYRWRLRLASTVAVFGPLRTLVAAAPVSQRLPCSSSAPLLAIAEYHQLWRHWDSLRIAVDNAIVVIENTFTHMQQGKSRLRVDLH